MTRDVHNVYYTSLQAYLHATYADLVGHLGEPNPADVGDRHKVRAEWHVDTPAGLVTIYDYRSEVPLSAVWEWHVGGHNRESVALVMEMLTGRVEP